eukprot:symbB.v1.2.033405.t1/scaffold4146.1/size43890/3
MQTGASIKDPKFLHALQEREKAVEIMKEALHNTGNVLRTWVQHFDRKFVDEEEGEAQSFASDAAAEQQRQEIESLRAEAPQVQQLKEKLAEVDAKQEKLKTENKQPVAKAHFLFWALSPRYVKEVESCSVRVARRAGAMPWNGGTSSASSSNLPAQPPASTGSSSSSSSWRRTPGAHLLQSKSNEGRFPSVVMIDPYFRDVALSNLLHWLEEDTAPPSEEPSSGQRKPLQRLVQPRSHRFAGSSASSCSAAPAGSSSSLPSASAILVGQLLRRPTTTTARQRSTGRRGHKFQPHPAPLHHFYHCSRPHPAPLLLHHFSFFELPREVPGSNQLAEGSTNYSGGTTSTPFRHVHGPHAKRRPVLHGLVIQEWEAADSGSAAGRQEAR